MKIDSRKIGKNKHILFVQFCKFIFIAFPEESLFAETNTICFFCEKFFGGHLRFLLATFENGGAKMILYYCGETKPTHRDHIVTMRTRGGY